jgi:TPR repeat protein
MKMKWCVTGFLLLVLCAGVQLHAQNADLDRKIFEQIKIKAENGDAGSESAIGWDYFNGVGVGRDKAEGIKWYRKAVEQNSAEAEWYLGDCYLRGDGVGQDSTEAIKLFRKSARQSYPIAEHTLGVLYENGSGVPKDYVEAVSWYRKAAEQGDAVGEFALANCYSLGIGVATNLSQAVVWWRKAAIQGDSGSQYNLGTSLLKGNGVTKDYVEAYKWLNLASAQENEFAKKNLSIVEQLMTSEQIAEAQQLSREFVPKKEMPSSIFANSTSPANPTFSGTGFFITDDGYLISNYHVVKDAAKVRLLTGAGLIDAKVVQVDAANDLALLKADGRFAPLPIAASRTGLLGGTVATVGFPNIGMQGFAPKLAKGEIASLSGAADDPRYFQISVPVQPGNSGGALVDERGNVIGIVSAKLDAGAALAASGALPENVNYAVKSSLLLSFLESVPAVSAKLKAPNTKDEKFEEVVKSAQEAAVLVLVY